MKNPILVVMKKELARFFGDRKLVVSILLPGVLIYVMYSFLGGAMTDIFAPEDSYVPSVAVLNLPASLVGSDEAAGVSYVSFDSADALMESVRAQESDAGVVFPEGFDEDVAVYDVSSGVAAPHVELYYNTGSVNSQTAYAQMTALLDSYETSLVNKFDVNTRLPTDGSNPYDLSEDSDATSAVFSMLAPMLLMIFLFTGCITVAPESIAGEKERGTLYTILVTPLKRSHLAVGKILALAIVALLGGASNFIGTMLALPKLMGGVDDGISATLYGVADYAYLAAIILSTVLLIITLISLLSAFAKSVKEAQTMVSPLMILVTLLAALSMVNQGDVHPAMRLIPLYNSILCMSDIFAFAVNPADVLIATVSNLAYSALGVFALSRAFASEKIMFSR